MLAHPLFKSIVRSSSLNSIAIVELTNDREVNTKTKQVNRVVCYQLSLKFLAGKYKQSEKRRYGNSSTYRRQVPSLAILVRGAALISHFFDPWATYPWAICIAVCLTLKLFPKSGGN